MLKMSTTSMIFEALRQRHWHPDFWNTTATRALRWTLMLHSSYCASFDTGLNSCQLIRTSNLSASHIAPAIVPYALNLADDAWVNDISLHLHLHESRSSKTARSPLLPRQHGMYSITPLLLVPPPFSLERHLFQEFIELTAQFQEAYKASFPIPPLPEPPLRTVHVVPVDLVNPDANTRLRTPLTDPLCRPSDGREDGRARGSLVVCPHL
ncbi:hypothetical protein R3P38DRAFT_3234039 [Favolaschia claudopus]|uniref:Uncharacterized protein n=1 Tax=Favolaschia claudopus TaxID=2862362 RepID=A0AAV9ZGZ7_9AGAR